MSPSPRGGQEAAKPSSALTIGLPDSVLDTIAERVADRLAERSEAEALPYIGVEEAAAYIDAPVSRIYSLVSAKRIPFHKDGSRLLFRRHELDDWIAKGGGVRPGGKKRS